MDKPKRWVKNVTKKKCTAENESSSWVNIWNYIFNPTFGFVHIWPKVGLKHPRLFLSVSNMMHEKPCKIYINKKPWRTSYTEGLSVSVFSAALKHGLKISHTSWTKKDKTPGEHKQACFWHLALGFWSPLTMRRTAGKKAMEKSVSSHTSSLQTKQIRFWLSKTINAIMHQFLWGMASSHEIILYFGHSTNYK